jgi:ABC-type transport system involved in multi-copper enzyme maturation permease subunit
VAIPRIVPPAAIITKDLRLRMRGWRWAGVATLYVAILGTIAIAFLLQKYSPTAGSSGASSPSRAGIKLFQTLSIIQLFLIVFVTPATVAGAISGERQHRTWDLLIASRVRTMDIIWGKLVAGIAFNLVLIGASLPIFSLVLLFGGIPPTDWVPPFVVFVVTVLLLGTISLAVSALTARLTVSFMLSMLVALLLTVGLSLLTLLLQAPGQLGIVSLGSLPFQTFNQPSPLTPLAQLDPLVALLSTLPASSGGTLLGRLGIVHHAFGLPWQLPWWAAYTLLAGLISLVLLLATTGLVRPAVRFRARGTHHGSVAALYPGEGRR